MMTNKERYKRTFKTLHSSPNTETEVLTMLNEQSKYRIKRSFPRAAAVCLVIALMVGSSLAAYAANVGGIQRIIQVWVHGDQTDAVIEFDGQGGYTLEYEDADGSVQTRGGGGVAYDGFGNERPLTKEELLEDLNSPDVREEDGVWTVYYYNQSTDITDKFDENGVCYIKLVHDGEELYMTVTKDRGYAASSDRYIDAAEL